MTPADELANKGRLNTGDVCFIQRHALSQTGQVRWSMGEKTQGTQPTRNAVGSYPHASVTRICGLDHMNRMLGPDNYKIDGSVLVNSRNPADDWRELAVLSDWTIDGVVLSNDNPHYYMSTTGGERNDQLFNVAIQGACQLNNGYEDYSGRGVAARHDPRQTAAAMGHTQRATYDERKEMRGNGGNGAYANVASLIGGPFYDQYPLQMFDRKVRPLSELYIGLVCKLIKNDSDAGGELTEFLAVHPGLKAQLDAYNRKKGITEEFGVGATRYKQDHIHVFRYQPFSDRQIWQMWNGKLDAANNKVLDTDIVDDPRDADVPRNRRGPLQTGSFDYATNLDQQLKDDDIFPRYRKAMRAAIANQSLKSGGVYDGDGSFAGIKLHEMMCMVGAWRLGKVLDTASQRKDSYHGGPIDTSFSVTLNCDLSFLDWRALRRRFGNGHVCSAHAKEWKFDEQSNQFVSNIVPLDPTDPNFNYDSDGEPVSISGEDGRVLQWPTKYVRTMREDTDLNIPIDPTTKDPDDSLYYRKKNKAEANKIVASAQMQIKVYKERLTFRKEPADPTDPEIPTDPNLPSVSKHGVQMYDAAVDAGAGVGNKRVAPMAAETAPSPKRAAVAARPTAAAAATTTATAAAVQPAPSPARRSTSTPPGATAQTPPASPAPVAAPTASSAGPLSFPGQAARGARKKRATVDAPPPSVPEEAAQASSSSNRGRSATTLGQEEDDIMASLFTSAGPTAASSSSATNAPVADASVESPSKAPRSFPRRHRDR